jgi:Spy/CpxP family protein refolding chaperone
MNTGNNNKVLLSLLVLLLLTNIGMLWYFTREEKIETKPVSRTERMAAMVQREMNLTDEQKQQYIALRLKRDSLLAPLNADLRAAKLEMINLLKQDNVPDSMVKAVADKIAAKQVPIEMEFYKHFVRIKAMCQPQQYGSFDSLLNRMVRRNTGDTTVPGGN